MAFHATRTWANAYANTEVRGWLVDAENNLNYPYHPQAGFVRIAFTHAFRLLIQGADYMTAMREVLSGGGDTDTNACIVGGLIGAADGSNAIPAEITKAVIECDTSKGRAAQSTGVLTWQKHSYLGSSACIERSI